MFKIILEFQVAIWDSNNIFLMNVRLNESIESYEIKTKFFKSLFIKFFLIYMDGGETRYTKPRIKIVGIFGNCTH